MTDKLVIFCTMLMLFLLGAKPNVMSREETLDITRFVSIRGERISDVTDGLSRLFEVPICAEESMRFSRHDDPQKPEPEGGPTHPKGFDLSLTNATLKLVLDRFVEKYPEYCWEYDVTNDIVNVFPKINAPASWIVESVNISSQGLEYIMFQNDMLGLKDHGIIFSPGRGNWSWMGSKTLTLKGNNVLLRGILNQICTQLPYRRYWVIKRMEKPGVTWNVKKTRVTHYLMFRPYIPFERIYQLRPPPPSRF